MGAWSQFTRQLLACAGRRNVISFSCIPISSLAKRIPFREDMELLKPVTCRQQNNSMYSMLGISALSFWGGTETTEAEEVSHSCPPSSAHSPVNKFTGVELQGQAAQEADTAEVVSNVHTAKWRVFTDLGRELFSKGRLDECENYLLQALEEAKQGFGEKDPHVASSCNNLAELYRMKRDYGKAEALFLEAVEILENAFNANHVSVSFTLHNLAGTYLVQRKFDQACKCYERSLEIKEKELGRNHPEYASTLFHFGEVQRLQGKFAEAENLIRESISILQEVGDGYSQVVIRRMGRLVEILSQTGQLKEAEKLQRKILHNLELSQGVESSNTTTAAENLAGTLQAVGKLEEAEELLQRSFEVRQKTLPPTHIQLGVTMFKMASVSIQRGDELMARGTDSDIVDAKAEYKRAEELLRKAVRIAERSWKPFTRSQGSMALRAGPLISLVRSLDALGTLEFKKMDLATTNKEMETGKTEAEKRFRHCLAVLDEPGVSKEVASIPEFQRQQVACLRHLAMLLSFSSNVEATSHRTAEIDQLLQKVEQIKADLNKHKTKVVP